MILVAHTLVLLALTGPPQQAAGQDKYVGSQMCATCHEDLASGFTKNPHSKVANNQSCESCHGPGREHAESADIRSIRSFQRLSPQSVAATCLGCHQKENAHSNRLFDTHTKRGLSCTSCHSVHGSVSRTPLLAKATAPLCATCHAPERSHFDRPFSHKVSQGAMDCVSCHSPHGSAAPAQMLTSHSNEAACLSCHGDKRGPFAFEHMPVRVDGCVSCHEPHGSANPRLLIRHEVRQLCLECHTNTTSAIGGTPPAFHDLRSERYRNCTTCHTKIHGSHTSRALLH